MDDRVGNFARRANTSVKTTTAKSDSCCAGVLCTRQGNVESSSRLAVAMQTAANFEVANVSTRHAWLELVEQLLIAPFALVRDIGERDPNDLLVRKRVGLAIVKEFFLGSQRDEINFRLSSAKIWIVDDEPVSLSGWGWAACETNRNNTDQKFK